MRALQRADGLGSPPGVGDIHLSYRLSHLGPEMKDSLNRGSSLRAGRGIGCYCSAKAFTVTSDLEASGGVAGGGGAYVAATGVGDTLRQVGTNRNLAVKRQCFEGSTSVWQAWNTSDLRMEHFLIAQCFLCEYMEHVSCTGTARGQ